MHSVAIPIEADLAISQREKGPIPSRPNILAGDEFGAALTNQYAAGSDELAAVSLYSQPLAGAVHAHHTE